MNTPSKGTPETLSRSAKRRILMISVSVALLIVLIAYIAWWTIFARDYESTDDAYVAGNMVQVTPQVGGTVVAIHADDTELVQAGKPLIELDRADAKVVLEQAEAQLAQTIREVRVLYTNNAALTANLAGRSGDVARSKEDLARRQELIATGAVSKEELAHARSALQSAESAMAATREQLAANRVLTEHTTVAQHPTVQRAAGRVKETYLAYARMTLPAPLTGYVAKRSVQIGQRVAAGTPLLSLVPLNAVWVDANFKESQIAQMHIGQAVTLHSDLYGSGTKYHGRVAGLAAGTGSAFSLLPAQNASGNWIKIVQRLPVRIALDPKELAEHPLRIGLSMQVEVAIEQKEGSQLAASPAARTLPAYATDVFDTLGQQADARVASILLANGANAAAQ